MASSNNFSFELVKKDRKTKARAGVIHTPHGDILTPAFSVVGTKASVKGLDEADLKNAGTQVVLANTYHLYLRPGVSVIKKFGGVGEFMKWGGPMITDSGGYQVSYLWTRGEEVGQSVKINDNGATFRSHIDGTLHTITPEISMQIQKKLGADIIMAFDQPIKLSNSKRKNEIAMKRTFGWEERSMAEHKKLKSNQALYGILHGGTDKKVRKQFLDFVLRTGFDGIAFGDETVGADPKLTAKGMGTVSEYLPDDKPVHALGLGGGPEGIFTGVELGMDTFDNTGITRMARSGLLYIYPEDGGTKLNKYRIDVSKSKFKDVKKPVSKICKCHACCNYSAAYVHHLLVSSEPLGVRLATIHNVHFINSLMDEIRKSIVSGHFSTLKKHWLGRAEY